ncbi:hypothetical protein [Brevundimonas sp.]|uniref:hypothetical protein n=1 Tax=Brevundimonas sp. TaxID=1871086 RepID=UPI00289C0023|nr:hypothetical protein [Brevundimonas sp.]
MSSNVRGKKAARKAVKRNQASPPSKKWEPAKRKEISPSAARTIERLPSMSLADTVRVWHNAIQILGSKQKKAFWPAAQQVLDGVENEWLRRRLNPASQDDFFKWPSTDAPGGNGSISSDGWVAEGVLGFLEYRVGKTADLSTPLRQSILAKVFEGVIPPAFPPAYLDQWGEPGSAIRLRKIAESIAAFARNAKRRSDSRLDQAIEDWESDLRYLYLGFYVGRFGFGWPSTHL